MNTIGNNIKRFRDRIGLSQEQIGSFLGKKREQIAFYENGSRNPSIEELNQLSDLFGIELSALLEEDDEMNAVDVALAFRSDEVTNDDLKQVADFQKIVKNYLKIQRIKNE